MPRLRDPLPGRAMVPGLLTTLPTPGRWWYLPLLRGDDHRRRAHRRHRREPTLARDRHTRPSLKNPPRFVGKLARFIQLLSYLSPRWRGPWLWWPGVVLALLGEGVSLVAAAVRG